MVALLPGFPAHVAAYCAIGKVLKEEYDAVVVKRVNEVAEQYGKVNFLVNLETDMENYSPGAFIEYLRLSFKHFMKWERMAIVTDESWIRNAYHLLSPFVHGEIRGYTLNQFAEAKKWVSGPPET